MRDIYIYTYVYTVYVRSFCWKFSWKEFIFSKNTHTNVYIYILYILVYSIICNNS